MKPRHAQALLLALGLLTRLPVQRWQRPSLNRSVQGLAVAYYPAVGVLLGLLLWLFQSALALLTPAPILAAFVILVLWVALTGALHLDGLADCVDAYFAGHKHRDPAARRDRMLAVMREPACGAMGAVALILVLLGKWLALAVLLEHGAPGIFAWVVLLALPRAALLPYMLSCDYARDRGMASALKTQLPKWTLLGVVLACAILATTLVPLDLALLVLAALTLLTWAWRSLWVKVIGGFTGDCLGGLVELAELTALVVLALALGASS